MNDKDTVVVPREPTPEMIAAWWRQKNCGSQDLSVRFGEGDAFSDYDAYAAMLAAAPSTSVREEELADQAQFLLDRLSEFEGSLVEPSEAASEFYGHVVPAIARLEAVLKPSTDKGDVG